MGLMNDASEKMTALVTGGAVRLGRSIVMGLVDLGYDIALHYHHSEDDARQVMRDVERRGSRCVLFRRDLSRGEGLDDFMRDVWNDCPRLSVLVNSASAYAQANLTQTGIADFDYQIAVNLRAPVFLTKAFAGVVSEGLVINILDNKIFASQYQYTAYLLAKKALAEFTKMSALELAPRIRVNGVAPGVIVPASSRSAEYVEWRVAGIPLSRQGDVEHVIQAVSYLLTNDFLTGQILVVDGGESMNMVGRNAGDFDPGKV
jgi:pteridine reductase